MVSAPSPLCLQSAHYHLHFPHEQLKKLNQAIDDCSSAIKLDDTYIKAYLRRAQWYVIH